jgi:hypothetical protein
MCDRRPVSMVYRFGRHRSRQALVTATILIAGACSTLSFDKIEAERSQICAGDRASKKYVFTLSVSKKVPAGLQVGDVERYMSSISRQADYLSDYFVYALFAQYWERGDNGDFHYGTLQDYEDLFEHAHHFRPSGEAVTSSWPHEPTLKLEWHKDYDFVASESYLADGLVNPANHTLIKSWSQGYLTNIPMDGRCREFYGDANPECLRSEKRGLLTFLRATGFNPGKFIEEHYFTVPEREHAFLCKKSNLSATCFSFDRHQLFDFESKLNADADFRARFPASAHFTGHSGPLAKSKMDKLVWESDYALDLVLLASTNVSKKIEGDWIISRVEFDPNLMCHYAKSKTNLYTR